ncbi:MAG: accessory Sec system translocase SecA2 [Fibrobacteres bacterium]|nr:accessory Sec system translocase SecA2 [Fibrobacterota bacterium]
MLTRVRRKIYEFVEKANGCDIEYSIDSYKKDLQLIHDKRAALKSLSNSEITSQSHSLKNKVSTGVALDSILHDAFALVYEAASRILNQNAYDEQIISGLVMFRGRVAEMQTGEGKTLAALFPAYLHALVGKGVHVLTFNDYLVRRDAAWMGPVYKLLGLTTGFIQEEMGSAERKKAYAADITYVTAKESGFDYLRDSLCMVQQDIVHRPFNAAIIDEADSILIDEARIPLVIAGPSGDDALESVEMAFDIHEYACKMKREEDFAFDAYERNIHLTSSGIKKIEDHFKCENLYDNSSSKLLSGILSALHAEHLLKRDREYIVRNGIVELVDELTGRVAERRRWPDALQAAVETKEGIRQQLQSRILNTITLQHLIRLYPKLCGMTGTALSAAKEFKEFYILGVTIIPTHKPCTRMDMSDCLYKTVAEKNEAIISEIVKVHSTGRPVLVGTRSVRESALLSERLLSEKISCNVLNAANDENEAEIIAAAGKRGAVTVSTNMAGRGTDIKLESAVNGGLFVIGCNRHESERIDNQLRGRSGRQGDPGTSKFFISLEDDLFVRYRLHELFPKTFNAGNMNFDDPIIRDEINRVQRIIEGQNLEIKITLFKYSVLLEKQRKVYMQKRNENLLAGNMITVHSLDLSWSHYLAEISEVRESIHLQRFSGIDPLAEFHRLAISYFDEAIDEALNRSDDDIKEIEHSLKRPSSTWTYLVNDNPFADMLRMKAGGTGMNAGSGLYWPLLVVYWVLGKRGKTKQ